MWSGKITPQQKDSYHKELLSVNKKINAFTHIDVSQGMQLATQAETSPLDGTVFGVKDNIAVETLPLTCGSQLLKDFISPYTASAVQALLKAGAIPVGKLNMDEFAMGSASEHSIFGAVRNPWDTQKTAGGSSGGSAAAVAAGMVPFALGSDTGGSVRQPAAFCGVYGLKPTYGSVSRYGLTAFASSLDVIGILARDVALMETIFNLIKVQERDPRDSSSGSSVTSFPPCKNIGVVRTLEGVSDEMKDAQQKTELFLQKSGYNLIDIQLPHMEYGVSVYYIIATAEASANLARFDGIRYGHRGGGYAENPIDMITQSRTEGFGTEVKLRMLAGSFVLRSGYQGRYYLKAQKIRSIMRMQYQKLFQTVDAILAPVSPMSPFPLMDSLDAGTSPSRPDDLTQKKGDRFCIPANLVGVPALSIPIAMHNGMPTAVQFIAPHHAEERLFHLATQCAQEFPLPQHPYLQNFEQFTTGQ